MVYNAYTELEKITESNSVTVTQCFSAPDKCSIIILTAKKPFSRIYVVAQRAHYPF